MNNKNLILLLLMIPVLFACGNEDLPNPGDDDDDKETVDWNAAANAGSDALINS